MISCLAVSKIHGNFGRTACGPLCYVPSIVRGALMNRRRPFLTCPIPHTQIYIQTTFVCGTKCEIAVITYLIRPMPEGLLLPRFLGLPSGTFSETAHRFPIINSFVIQPTSIKFMDALRLVKLAKLPRILILHSHSITRKSN